MNNNQYQNKYANSNYNGNALSCTYSHQGFEQNQKQNNQHLFSDNSTYEDAKYINNEIQHYQISDNYKGPKKFTTNYQLLFAMEQQKKHLWHLLALKQLKIQQLGFQLQNKQKYFIEQFQSLKGHFNTIQENNRNLMNQINRLTNYNLILQKKICTMSTKINKNDQITINMVDQYKILKLMIQQYKQSFHKNDQLVKQLSNIIEVKSNQILSLKRQIERFNLEDKYKKQRINQLQKDFTQINLQLINHPFYSNSYISNQLKDKNHIDIQYMNKQNIFLEQKQVSSQKDINISKQIPNKANKTVKYRKHTPNKQFYKPLKRKCQQNKQNKRLNSNVNGICQSQNKDSSKINLSYRHNNQNQNSQVITNSSLVRRNNSLVRRNNSFSNKIKNSIEI